MGRVVDAVVPRLLLRWSPPQEEGDRLGLGRHGCHDGSGQALPAPVRMTAGTPTTDREDDVEEEHAVPRPRFEGPIPGNRSSEVGLQLSEDHAQRWRDLHAGPNRERQAVRLARTVVRVLPEDHGPHRSERGQAERGEDLAGRWIDVELGALAGDERLQGIERGKIKAAGQNRAPVGRDRLHHRREHNLRRRTTQWVPAAGSPRLADAGNTDDGSFAGPAEAPVDAIWPIPKGIAVGVRSGGHPDSTPPSQPHLPFSCLRLPNTMNPSWIAYGTGLRCEGSRSSPAVSRPPQGLKVRAVRVPSRDRSGASGPEPGAPTRAGRKGTNGP